MDNAISPIATKRPYKIVAAQVNRDFHESARTSSRPGGDGSQREGADGQGKRPPRLLARTGADLIEQNKHAIPSVIDPRLLGDEEAGRSVERPQVMRQDLPPGPKGGGIPTRGYV